MTEHPLIAAARALAPTLASRAAETEAARRLPQDLSDALGAAGVYRMLVPEHLGGGAVHPRVFGGALRELARGDGAAAWVAMTGSTTGILMGWLAESAASSILADDPDAAFAGVFAPTGMAVPVAGGYRVTGRWGYGSGSHNARWLMGGAVVPTEEGPRMLPSGGPEIRSCFFPAAEVEILDTWHVSGLRGTGSHDFVANDVFVPEAHTTCLFTDAPGVPTPLSRFPVFGILASGVAAVGLGIAQAALDAAHDHVLSKRPVGSRKTAADSERVQIALARGAGELGAAQAFLESALDATWAEASVGAPSVASRARLRLAATHAAGAAAAVVDRAYGLCGGAAIWDQSPLSRQFRDVHVMTQHIMVGPATLRAVGRLGLGLPTNIAQL